MTNLRDLFKPLKILLIEDDAIEVMKFNRVLSGQQLHHTVTHAGNGAAALEILSKTHELPNIILLDLNMPKINGIEFLTQIKQNSKLNHIPVVILTTSANYDDLKECYKLGIAGYLSKPLSYEDYVIKIESCIKYWSINEMIIK